MSETNVESMYFRSRVLSRTDVYVSILSLSHIVFAFSIFNAAERKREKERERERVRVRVKKKG